MTKELLQQVLDALLGYKPHSLTHAKEQGMAIIALREAIAQPVSPANRKLLEIIAAAYQIAGACDAPNHVLDVLANPETATQKQIDAMLPFVQTAPESKA